MNFLRLIIVLSFVFNILLEVKEEERKVEVNV